jgi:DNA-binding NtrC family response regulator
MAKEKILLVDDEREFVKILSQRIEARGVAVETATNGPEAIRKVEDGVYDAIFLDLAMPEMDGIETLRRLLEKNPDLQVILLTGHATLEKGIEAMKFGAMDFLEKPARIQELMKKIEQAKSKRMLITEARMEERLKDIWKSKGW